ncbi:MAG: DUF2064 domain-containing protein [Chloroflexi bacterium]|nr:DUF2064 domain-containing protein [Chloroflexota bacterium]
MTRAFVAIVPVIDEETAIGDVVRGLHAAGACCVVVVDGGSRDDTQAIATTAGAIVLVESRRGYGRACRSGAQHALQSVAMGHVHDQIAFLDGDGSCDPADLPPLVDALDEADLALGVRERRLVEAGAMAWHARLGNQLVAAILSARSGRRVHDLAPSKALRRATLEQLHLDDDGYGWTTQLVARGLVEPTIRIREVPVGFGQRRGGKSKVSGSWKASLAAGRAMLGVAWRETARRPLLCVMAKAPGAKNAKTRLATSLGADRTARFWEACLADVADGAAEAARSVGAAPVVMLPDRRDAGAVLRIVGSEWTPIVQTRPGLAAALVDVFLAAFDRGADRAVALAGDSPGLPPSRIKDAVAVLDRAANGAVLGPTDDGGYHLVGLRWRPVPRWLPGPHRRLLRRRLERRLRRGFSDRRMGGSSAFDATRRDLVAAGWHVTIVEPWPDVDTVSDLRQLAEVLNRDGLDPRWGSRTREWLARNGSALDDGNR